MEPADGSLGLSQHGVGVLHNRVRGETAIRRSQVHRTATGMESQADPLRGLDLGLQEVAGSRRKDVVVVGRGRTARQGQLGEPGPGGHPYPFGVEPGPHRVELREPAEQAVLLGSRPGECLVQVVMGVHQARDRHTPPAVEHVGTGHRGGRRDTRADPADHAVLEQDRPPGQLGPRVVHGGDNLAAGDEEPAHAVPRSIRVAARRTASRIFW